MLLLLVEPKTFQSQEKRLKRHKHPIKKVKVGNSLFTLSYSLRHYNSLEQATANLSL